MTPTFETVLTQAKSLPPIEREKLIESLRQVLEKDVSENRREKIRAFRGKFRRILPSVEEFLAEKSKEAKLEERR